MLILMIWIKHTGNAHQCARSEDASSTDLSFDFIMIIFQQKLILE